MVTRGLVFSFKELLIECEIIKSYAQRFLDRTTISLIDEVRGNLQSIQLQGSTSETTRWSLPEERPLCTVWSEGESKPDGKSGHHIRGEFSFVWQIRPLNEKPWLGRSHLLLDGLASTVVSVVDKRKQCLAQWTIEIGDGNSPGVHFHSQVKRFGSAPFPIALDVPRLPALPMSPFLTLEFAIGELFQDRWRKHAVGDSDDARRWRGIHEPRLKQFFAWQMAQLASPSVGSPWMSLKSAKPPVNLMVTVTR